MVNLAGNGASAATGNGPASGYTLNIVWFLVLFMFYNVLIMNTNTCLAITFSLFYMVNYLLNFGIKMCRILPTFLTIQKPDLYRLSVTGFAAALRPNIFDGANYKRWRDKMVLWLTAMNVIHVA